MASWPAAALAALLTVVASGCLAADPPSAYAGMRVTYYPQEVLPITVPGKAILDYEVRGDPGTPAFHSCILLKRHEAPWRASGGTEGIHCTLDATAGGGEVKVGEGIYAIGLWCAGGAEGRRCAGTVDASLRR